MHINLYNPKAEYFLQSSALEGIALEKSMGVIINRKVLKFECLDREESTINASGHKTSTKLKKTKTA